MRIVPVGPVEREEALLSVRSLAEPGPAPPGSGRAPGGGLLISAVTDAGCPPASLAVVLVVQGLGFPTGCEKRSGASPQLLWSPRVGLRLEECAIPRSRYWAFAPRAS